MQTNTPNLVFVTETGNEEIHYSHAEVSKKHQTFKQFLPISMKLFQIILNCVYISLSNFMLSTTLQYWEWNLIQTQDLLT